MKVLTFLKMFEFNPILPDDLVRVPNPSIALEKGLLFLLLRVGVVRDPRGPSARLLTLVVLPRMFQPDSGLSEDWGEAAIIAPEEKG